MRERHGLTHEFLQVRRVYVIVVQTLNRVETLLVGN
jgi:hypothetical protein